MGNDITDVQALLFSENDLSREYRIVAECKQGEHARVCICDWAEAKSKQYDSGRKRHAKQIVDLVRAENFELNGIPETLKDVSACVPSVC